MLNFGYHPIPDDLDIAFAQGNFQRGIVVDSQVTELYELIQEVRTLPSLEVELPSGVYWFRGMGDAAIMLIPVGRAGASSRLDLDKWDPEVQHPLIEAFSWFEALWLKAEPIWEPVFQIGARVITLPAGVDVEVVGRSYYAGAWSYQVRGPEGVSSQIESKLEEIKVSDEPEDWVRGEKSTVARFGATLTRTKILGRFADTVYSYGATRTVFRPYQFKPVLKLLQSGLARLLIADEVGLGKTIEAGLIWTELEARQDADRVLVVCPSALIDKWRVEMDERFGFELVTLDREGRTRFVENHREGRLPKRRAYVASIESLRSWDALVEFEDNPPEFDLVIVDEAHSMRNGSTKSYLLGAQLSEWTSGSNLVFLSATPINLHETDLLNLLGLLDPSDFGSLDDLQTRLEPNAVLNDVAKLLVDQNVSLLELENELSKLDEMVFGAAVTLRPEFTELTTLIQDAPLSPRKVAEARGLIGKLNTLSTAITRTRRAEVDEKKAVRSAAGIQIRWTETESNFYNEFLRWCEKRAKVAGTPMYFCMQMPIRLASTTLKLAAKSVLSNNPEHWAGDTKKKPPGNWISPHPELEASARLVLETPDTKLARLDSVLEELAQLRRPAILFTWSKENLRYLQTTYNNKYRIAVMSGDVSREARRIIMRDFRDGKFDFLFANRVASEGLDFEFCSAVINYDLPWNPMEIEQRIGRIDRIGQMSEKILIRNFYNDEAIDSRILYKVLERIEIFEKSIGELDEIIGQHMDELRTAIDFSLTESQRDAKATQFLTAIEAQKAASRELADSAAGLMISGDFEISGFRDDLIASGRYLGQIELAHLIDDWARTDGGNSLEWLREQSVAELIGNSVMASRLNDLNVSGKRTRAETKSLVSALQNGTPIHLALEQETARRSGLELLSATHPLVMAAAEVPGHKHARFASVSIPATEDISPGTYLVVLALATNASLGGDEIWGAAVDMDGIAVGEGPANAALAALAVGKLAEGSVAADHPLPFLTGRAKLQLELRHRNVQERRDREEAAWVESRKAVLTDQHLRRVEGIKRRLQTVVDRERSEQILRMVKGQISRQEERHQLLITELESRTQRSVSLKYIAVCTMDVIDD